MIGNPSLPFYGLQPQAATMYSAYGGGLEGLAALQRDANLHTLVGSAAAAAAAAQHSVVGSQPTVPQPGSGGKSTGGGGSVV